MSERTPDIEIYLQAAAIDGVERWLATCFRIESTGRANAPTRRYRVTLPDSPEAPIEVLVVPDAVAQGHYTSVWFRENHTPWADDLACARDACRFLNTEARCSAGSWQENDAGPGWWCLRPNGREQRIEWE